MESGSRHEDDYRGGDEECMTFFEITWMHLEYINTLQGPIPGGNEFHCLVYDFHMFVRNFMQVPEEAPSLTARRLTARSLLTQYDSSSQLLRAQPRGPGLRAAVRVLRLLAG